MADTDLKVSYGNTEYHYMTNDLKLSGAAAIETSRMLTQWMNTQQVTAIPMGHGYGTLRIGSKEYTYSPGGGPSISQVLDQKREQEADKQNSTQ
jgi:hypothetical protein